MGSVEAALVVAPGQTLASASYVITGPGGFTRSGHDRRQQQHDAGGCRSVDCRPAPVTPSPSPRPAPKAELTCSGSAMFDVVARMTTLVQIHIRCLETPRNGSIGVNGTINVCPLLDALSALPAEVMVGSSIALSAAAHDLDNRPALLTYQWTATAGMLSSPSGTSTNLTLHRCRHRDRSPSSRPTATAATAAASPDLLAARRPAAAHQDQRGRIERRHAGRLGRALQRGDDGRRRVGLGVQGQRRHPRLHHPGRDDDRGRRLLRARGGGLRLRAGRGGVGAPVRRPVADAASIRTAGRRTRRSPTPLPERHGRVRRAA